MTIQLTVPSKTFLLGEYAVLKGSPAILLTTKQRFKLIATPKTAGTSGVEGIHPDSPAGKFIKHHADFYDHYHLQFIDPYQQLGGLGASSAQFVMVFALRASVLGIKINDTVLLDEYINVAWDGAGMPPSGADVIAQLHGKICFYHKPEKKCRTFSWPFPDLAYGLIHTRHKLSTHTHLKQLTDIDELTFEKIVQLGLKSLITHDSTLFIESIKNYAATLKSQHLVTKETSDMLDSLSANPDILACKGCGALGADVILVLFHRQSQDHVLRCLLKQNLHCIAYGHQVENGLEIETI